MIPKKSASADQARELGLSVGDTIVGDERDEKMTSWVRRYWLTLLYAGKTETVWDVWFQARVDGAPKYLGEFASWTLDRRDWTRCDGPPKTLPVAPAPDSVGGLELLLGGMRVTFSRYCVSGIVAEGEQCQCWRCRSKRGEEAVDGPGWPARSEEVRQEFYARNVKKHA